MGNAGEGSLRAWQLDFRCAAVRKKTGGSGIVLLSATPAKNSPLEFYNLIQYIDHDAWSRAGILHSEQFIDRYLNIEIRPVVNTAMQIEDRSAVIGFKNLHELRDIIFRYGEFRTAEDVGLVLPKPEVEIVQVSMDDAQEAKYQEYVERIEALVTGKDKDGNEVKRTPGSKIAILGLLARLALVAIHSQLDEGLSWKAAQDPRIDPNSPKFDALSDRVFTNRACGHIVFVDNLAAHAWVRRVLIARGVPADRIAVLNGETAKSPADRLRIAEAFNGNPEEGIAPAYDVVIANAIAYEGIDLQTRTCAIHHLDLPWEPATLQQRNGRGVRQGNRLSSIAIYYYFSRRSQDGLRYNLIAGKLGWMVELLKSQRRDTNNPGAQLDLGPEEVLLLISRDPEKTRVRLDAIKAARAAEARAKLLEEAVRIVRSANTRLRKAERTSDPTEAARLRLEAEERLKDLGAVDPEAWPWARQIPSVRERDVLVVSNTGLLLYEGLRLAIPSDWNADRVEHIELGRIVEDRIAVREAGTTAWTLKGTQEPSFARVRPEHLDGAWPSNDEEVTMTAIQGRLSRERYLWDWRKLGWREGSEVWREAVWRRFGKDVLALMVRNADYATEPQLVPAIVQGRLTILTGRALGTPGAVVLAPTNEGWRKLLEAARKADLKYTELDAMARYWWDRPFPRGFLRGDEEEAP